MRTLLDDSDAATARATLDAQQDVITTRGDLVRGSSVSVAERLALGASGTFLKSDGSDPSWVEQQFYPRGYLSGLAVTRTSATEFNVNKGVCRAGSNSDQDLVDIENTNALFGKLFNDAGWSAGDGGGGVPSGAGFATAIDTWHFFMIVKQDGSAYDFGWDTNLAAAFLQDDAAVIAALGAGAYFRRLRSNVSTATPNFVAFSEDGDETLLDAAVQDNRSQTPGADTLVTHTLPSVPDGIRTKALVSIHFKTAASGFHSVGHGDISTLPTPTDTVKDAETVTEVSETVVWTGALRTSTSQAIKTRTDTDPTTVDVNVRGWIDRRGRDD